MPTTRSLTHAEWDDIPTSRHSYLDSDYDRDLEKGPSQANLTQAKQPKQPSHEICAKHPDIEQGRIKINSWGLCQRMLVIPLCQGPNSKVLKVLEGNLGMGESQTSDIPSFRRCKLNASCHIAASLAKRYGLILATSIAPNKFKASSHWPPFSRALIVAEKQLSSVQNSLVVSIQ